MELLRDRRVQSIGGNRSESAALFPVHGRRGGHLLHHQSDPDIGPLRCPPSGNRQWCVSTGQLSRHDRNLFQPGRYPSVLSLILDAEPECCWSLTTSRRFWIFWADTWD